MSIGAFLSTGQLHETKSIHTIYKILRGTAQFFLDLCHVLHHGGCFSVIKNCSNYWDEQREYYRPALNTILVLPVSAFQRLEVP
mmetsp:Transcript_35609/g.62951  ORF Transcript_35609/g.62951 Transcript_35609/m.62951 type:complete len:84 (-) Transcript_35609:1657-1908(-)